MAQHSFFVRKRLKITMAFIIVVLAYNIYTGFKPFHPYLTNLGLIGSIIAIMGALVRSWAAGVIVKKKQLATTGPYSLFRHPLYIGSFLMAIGFAILMRDIKVYILVTTLILGVYIPRIKDEELALSKKFPADWRNFCVQTGLFFPKKFPRKVCIGWSLNQWFKNKEYNALFTVLAAIAGLWWWVK